MASCSLRKLSVLQGELALFVRNAVSHCHFHRHRPGRNLANLAFDRVRYLRVAPQIVLGIFTTLSEPGIAIREERAALADDLEVSRDVEDAALPRNSLVVHDVELGGAEGR